MKIKKNIRKEDRRGENKKQNRQYREIGIAVVTVVVVVVIRSNSDGGGSGGGSDANLTTFLPSRDWPRALCNVTADWLTILMTSSVVTQVNEGRESLCFPERERERERRNLAT